MCLDPFPRQQHRWVDVWTMGNKVNRTKGRSMRGWGEWLFGIHIHLPGADNKAGSALALRKQNSPLLRTPHMLPSPLLKATPFPTIFLIKASFPCFLISAPNWGLFTLNPTEFSIHP